MAKVLVNDSSLTSIADAIREKTGGTDTYKPSEMAGAIASITTGGEAPEYTQVSYIKFNADMRFDTEIIGNQDTKIKIVYTRDSDGAFYMYGVANSGNTASITAYLSSGGTWRFGAKGASYNVAVNEDLVHTAIVSKTSITRVGTTSSFSGVADFETIGSIILGACRNPNGAVGVAQYIGKIYEFKIWDGDTLVLDFKPCVNSDGIYGFYDEVKQKFVAPMDEEGVETYDIED